MYIGWLPLKKILSSIEVFSLEIIYCIVTNSNTSRLAEKGFSSTRDNFCALNSYSNSMIVLNVNPLTYKRTKSWSHVRGPQRSLTPAAWATSTREKYGQLLQHKGPIHYLQEMMIKLHQRTFISFNKCNIAFLSGPKYIFQTSKK